ncbi:hypothetical protein CN373_07055 [Bacillus cereus]|uniref:hypothetical protein n=1 Tax=Bacillus cereus TaxID=1396 RepID=UPI000BF5BE3C|nr:hypothetical protein [Bacillus cereus]PFA23133.1 hypothetical protein CN373_07055 [Bacillus cereus]
MRIRHEYDYAIIEGDEDVMQRATIKGACIGTEPMPAGVNLYYFYDKAQKTKTTGDANVYVLYRQMYLNKFDTKEKGATK